MNGTIRTALILSALFTLIVACGQEREPVDRVQPNAIAKSYFDGEWYFQRTAVDVPSGNGFTFVGSTDFNGLSIVAFVISTPS